MGGMSMKIKDVDIQSVYMYEKTDDGKKLLIWNTVGESHYLALRLIQAGIDFYGFFNPHQGIEMDLLNKEALGLDRLLEAKGDYVILVPYSLRRQVEAYEQYSRIKDVLAFETIRAEVREKDNVVIYGAGKRSRALYKNLRQEADVQIKMILDSDPSKEHTTLGGTLIRQPDALRELTGTTAVIIASVYVSEMYETLRRCHVAKEDIYVDIRDLFLDCGGADGPDLYIDKISFFQMSRTLHGKSAALYGRRAVVTRMADALKKAGVLYLQTVCRDGEAETGEIYRILDLAKDGKKTPDYLLLTDRPNRMQYRAISDMGGYDDRHVLYGGQNGDYYSYNINLMTYGLDPTLGYVKFKDQISQSFQEYAWNGCAEGSIRILTLGGSTTDAVGARNRCWPACLSDLLKEGGTASYL